MILVTAELQLVQQLVNQLHSRRRDEEMQEAARFANIFPICRFCLFLPGMSQR
jgi:hypothetical protein